MMSLFSSFDSLYFIRSFILYLMFFSFFSNFLFKFNLFLVFKKMFNMFTKKFLLVLKNLSFNKGKLLFFINSMILIFFMNFLSIFSFNFPHSSQVGVVLFFSLFFWLSFILYFTMNNIKGFFYHCVPEGSPLYLVFFLFFIELISNSIRPITLTVRLVANILTGHLLMILLSKLALNSFYMSLFYTILNTVELFVSIIQAYIFGILITLFYAEVN